MSDTQTIPRTPSSKTGHNAALLKDKGLLLIQRLAGDSWTDYNEHDPGVTILEQLSYALTELSYRADFPMADLLTNPESKRIDFHDQALFSPLEIYPSAPQTINDYRKLIIDSIPSVTNAWLTVQGPQLYGIQLLVPDLKPCPEDPNLSPQRVIRQTQRLYSRNRNLCEDLGEVTILQPIAVKVFAIVNLDSETSPEETLANILFKLGNHLAPEPKRKSLKELLDQGREVEDIFNGPLMYNGFIDDEQLPQRTTTFVLRDILHLLVKVDGIVGVRNLRCKVDGKEEISEGSFTIAKEAVPNLIDTVDADGNFTIELCRHGECINIDFAKVNRLLQQLWGEHRQQFELSSYFEEYLALPTGKARDLGSYYGIQNQFPNVYGIGSFGLPEDASSQRKAQAKQLKGYLLLYEQLLANSFSQLAAARELFSISSDLSQSYFSQSLAQKIPNVAPLLKTDSNTDGYEKELEELIQSQDDFPQRRNRFLDFLLAIHGQTLEETQLIHSVLPKRDKDGQLELIAAKKSFLANLKTVSRNRGLGFDLLHEPSVDNIAGMEFKCRIQLGMKIKGHRPLQDILDDINMTAMDMQSGAYVGRSVENRGEYIKEFFDPISRSRSHAENDKTYHSHNSVGEFYCGSFPGDDKIALVHKMDPTSDWRLVGKYKNLPLVQEAIDDMAEQMAAIEQAERQLYIVEHNLLRFAQQDNPNIADELTISAILTLPAPDSHKERVWDFAQKVIRNNCPAHIRVRVCFITATQMCSFEELHLAWKSALRKSEPKQMVTTSNNLINFLAGCDENESEQ
ncbi:MAG: hypothetical protein HQL69_07115 [Magnetococcales bacterium]|nr:hypothetical protein [Magnetococcales bacterium]